MTEASILRVGTYRAQLGFSGATPSRRDRLESSFARRDVFECCLSGRREPQTPDSPEIAACKATGLLALKEKSPAVVDLVLDMDTLIVSKANTDIEGTPVRTVVMGVAYLEKKGTGKAQHFLCLIGDKGKVLLTFFAVP